MTAISENVLPETLLAEALEQLQQERATRQQLQEELARERSLRRSLVDSMPDLVFYKAKDGTYLGCNQAFAEFVGRTESEIVGRTDAEIFAPSCAEAIQKRDRQVYATGEAQRTEEWANFPCGDRRLLDTLKNCWG
jgi:two-component system, cell cycle sensor histidine kinase and response regulator CckA